MGIIDTVYPDGSPVSKADVRADDKTGHRRNMASVSDVNNTDLTGQYAGIYVRSLQKSFDLETGSLDADDGGATTLVDNAGNVFKAVAGSDAGNYTTPALGVSKSLASFPRLYINAAQEGVPNDGSADAAAKLQDIVTWVATNRPRGALIDCSDGIFRMDSTVTVQGNDIVLGGRGTGELANFHRNHDAGPLLFFTAPGTGATQISRSGVKFAAIRDLGTGTNGNSQRTGLAGTWANSPYGLRYETVDQAIVYNIEFYNESLGMFGTPNCRPSRLHHFFNRTLDTGRIAWNFTGGTLSSTAFPRSSGAWGDIFDIEAGILNGGTIYPSCDYGLIVDQCDGFSLDQSHVQYTNLRNYSFAPSTDGRQLFNVEISNAYSDLCLGHGVFVGGSIPIQSFKYSGVISGGGYGLSKDGLLVSNAIQEAAFDIDRLDGFANGAVISGGTVIDLSIRIARNLTSGIVAITGGDHINIKPGSWDGGNSDRSAALAANGVYVGNASEVHVSGGRISWCTNGIVFDSGSSHCSAAGVNVRENVSIPISNSGTNNSGKGNIGATDF